VASYTRVRSTAARIGRAGLVRDAAVGAPWVRTPERNGGRPGAAGRLSGDGANGRAIERMATPRAGIARCRLESWLAKSVTDELGRFSILERRSGGTSTAAQAAATTSRTSCPIGNSPFGRG
jgi:hypothetical protein